MYAIDIDMSKYLNRVQINKNVNIIEKASSEITRSDIIEPLDLVYLDADHNYDSVKKDIQVFKNTIKPGGFFVFNDFTIFSVHELLFYGVAQAVSEFIIEEEWEVYALTLDEWNFYDIALRKPSSNI